MSRATAADNVYIVLTLGILASPIRAEVIQLSDTQMDSITAGVFIVLQDPNILAFNPNTLVGLLNGQPIVLQSSDNGNTYHLVADGTIWTTKELYISTTQGYAAGFLSGPQGQSWDGGHTLPPDYVLTPNVIRGARLQIPERGLDLLQCGNCNRSKDY